MMVKSIGLDVLSGGSWIVARVDEANVMPEEEPSSFLLKEYRLKDHNHNITED